MICSQCNKKFIPSHHNQKYCSKECVEIKDKKYNKKYQQSDKGKKAIKKYRQSDKGKETSNKWKDAVGIEYQKIWGQSKRGKEITKKSREKNKEKTRIARLKKPRSDKDKLYSQNYYQSNKTKINSYTQQRKKTDIIFRLKGNLRSRLHGFLQISNLSKKNKTFKMVGCTPEFLKKYLEKQFHHHPDTHQPMNWLNYTVHGWHIDHRTPLDSAKTPEDVEKLMHYTNLQPMWATENWKKGAKY